jgi:molybdate transport system ATP-binding protein
MPLLSFDCQFRYPSGFLLDFAFEVDDGIAALFGPSGSGKTSTLHLIAGLLQPLTGRIALGERVLFDAKKQINVPIHGRRVGLVFQDYQLFPHLTVESNLRYGLRRSPASQIDFSRLVEVLELRPLLKRYPRALSGGEQQRVALGRAIAAHPTILLLDEPVSALDDQLRTGVLAHLREILNEFPISTLLVTHDLRNIEMLEARVINMPRATIP